ncbi:MAG: hypothetical protein ACUZ8H_02465 [Candidatus Anammoxibacter sp.]
MLRAIKETLEDNYFQMAKTRIKVYYFLVMTALVFTGCAALTKTAPDGDNTSRLFYESYDTTWKAVMSALDTVPLDVVEKRDGFIKTGWVTAKSDKEFSGIFSAKQWKERVRLLISVTSMPALGHSTEVSIIVHVEEKPPAGMEAYRWKRKASDGTVEHNVLEKIYQFLHEAEAPQLIYESDYK